MAKDFYNREETEDYVIEEDGSVSPPPDMGNWEWTIPYQLEEFRVKFNSWPSLTLVASRDSRLKSLKNFPLELAGLRLYNVDKLANLKGGPKKVQRLLISNCGVTSLSGAPTADEVQLIGLKMLTSLHGLEERSVEVLDISDCQGLQSLEGAPISMEGLAISSCTNLDVVKLKNSRMVGKGVLSIDSGLAHKLSPTLVTVPGLKEIEFMGYGYREDILELFKARLNQPNKKRAYLELQQDLIDNDLDDQADL